MTVTPKAMVISIAGQISSDRRFKFLPEGNYYYDRAAPNKTPPPFHQSKAVAFLVAPESPHTGTQAIRDLWPDYLKNAKGLEDLVLADYQTGKMRVKNRKGWLEEGKFLRLSHALWRVCPSFY